MSTGMYCTLIQPVRKVTNPGHALYADTDSYVRIMIQGMNSEKNYVCLDKAMLKTSMSTVFTVKHFLALNSG